MYLLPAAVEALPDAGFAAVRGDLDEAMGVMG
jgi:hypothetical protein